MRGKSGASGGSGLCSDSLGTPAVGKSQGVQGAFPAYAGLRRATQSDHRRGERAFDLAPLDLGPTASLRLSNP